MHYFMHYFFKILCYCRFALLRFKVVATVEYYVV